MHSPEHTPPRPRWLPGGAAARHTQRDRQPDDQPDDAMSCVRGLLRALCGGLLLWAAAAAIAILAYRWS